MNSLLCLFLILFSSTCSCWSVRLVSLPTFQILLTETGEIIKLDGTAISTSELQYHRGHVQLIIFGASIVLLLLFSLVLCFICSKGNRNQRQYVSARPSISSLDQLVQRRLQDRPPIYSESQLEIVSTEPPTYEEALRNCPRCASVYMITKTNNSHETAADNISTCSDPPDYILSEGAVNPAFEGVASSHPEENDSDRWITGNYI